MKTYSIFPSLSDLLSMIISSGICVAANGIMLFFIVTIISLCICTTSFLSIYLLMDI